MGCYRLDACVSPGLPPCHRYVYAASALNAGPKREAMRAHIFHEEPLRKLLDLSGLADVLPPGVDDHVRRLKALMSE